MKTLSGLAALAAFSVVWLFASGSACAQKAPIPASAVADGTPTIDASMTRQDWPSALKQLDARIASNPRDAQAQFKRATVLARLGRDSDAAAAFTALTQSYPELPEPYNNLAALQAKEGHYDEARGTLETAVKANPQFALAYQNLGDLYLQLASRAYGQALKLDGKNTYAAQRMTQVQQIVAPHSMRVSGVIDARRNPRIASAAAAPPPVPEKAPGGMSALPPTQFIPGAAQAPVR